MRHPHTQWERISPPAELNSGDRIRTGPESEAVIVFPSGHSAFVKPETEVTIEEAAEEETALEMLQGRMRSELEDFGAEDSYEIKTPQAVIAVRGTVFEVRVAEELTRVEVYSGIVEAMERITGEKVHILPGEFSEILQDRRPSDPEKMEKEDEKPDKGKREDAPEEDADRRDVRREMYSEISREGVFSGGAGKVIKGEMESGGDFIDADGRRVRVEEYIVGPDSKEFDYLVLNKRGDRYDLGEINFVFNKELPGDLSLVMPDMFYSESSEKPEWILEEMTSVMSGETCSVVEKGEGGDMLEVISRNDAAGEESTGMWIHYFNLKEFYIEGEGEEKRDVWEIDYGDDVDSWGELQNRRENYEQYDIYSGFYDRKTSWEYPRGDDLYFTRKTYEFGDEVEFTVEGFTINNEGEPYGEDDFNFLSDGLMTHKGNINFERRYGGCDLNRDIELVFSPGALYYSGFSDDLLIDNTEGSGGLRMWNVWDLKEW